MADLVVSGLSVVLDTTADLLDLLTLPEAKLAIKYDGPATTYDTKLRSLITAVSRRLDQLCGPIVVRTITAETHHGGKGYVRLLYCPVLSVTTVTEYAYTTGTTLTPETNAAKTASNYSVDLETGRVFRRATNYDQSFASGRNNIAVTYEAGRYATTTTVDARFKETAKITLAHLWRPEQGFASIDAAEFVVPSGFAIPNQALDLIADDVRGPMVAG